MADTSFYGGRAGFSFVIVKSFPSIAEMVKQFKKGPSYTAVHYDEHVLINTENKNDPDNGKVYRRGYDYGNEMGGAVYIGTIVGPAGRAPMLELGTIEQVKAKQQTEGFAERYGEGSYTVPTSLVPGKNGTTYNDAVKWACCCVRSENGEDSTAYIGFQFPYLVEEFTAQSESPYYNRSNDTATFINQNLTERVDDKAHPFYEKWHFHIPKGIKGDAFKNFRVVGADNSIQDYTDKANDIAGIDSSTAKPRQVLVYDYYHYDKNEDGEPVSIFLGDYNMIDDIDLDNEGTIVIRYTHDNTDTYTKMLKWIKEVTLDSTNGHFTVKYNHDTDKDEQPTIYETDLAWVKSISIAEDGKITLHYTGNKEDEILSNTHLRWIKNIEMSADGSVTVNYNDGTKEVFDKKIQWITNISLAEDGTFTVTYNNETPPYTTTLTWVRDISIDDNGTITIQYNHGEPLVYEEMLKYIDHIYFNKVDEETQEGDNKFHVVYNNDDDETIDNIIKFIDRVYVDDDDKKENSNYLFHVVYNTGEDKAISTQPVNYINETVIDEKDYHFLVYYSNGKIRKLLEESGKTRTYGEKNGWLDLGSIKDDAGFLVGFNILPSEHSEDEIKDTTKAIKYLNKTYPNGLTNPLYYGKIVTIGDEGENKLFYAFDYDYKTDTTEYKGWYYLGSFNNEVSWTMVASKDDATLEAQQKKLAIGGVWFIVEGEDD